MATPLLLLAILGKQQEADVLLVRIADFILTKPKRKQVSSSQSKAKASKLIAPKAKASKLSQSKAKASKLIALQSKSK